MPGQTVQVIKEPDSLHMLIKHRLVVLASKTLQHHYVFDSVSSGCHKAQTGEKKKEPI